MSSRVKLFSVMPSNRIRGKRHKNRNAGNSYELEEKLFYCEGERVMEQAAQIDCRISFSGDIQNPPGCFPVQPTVGNLL